MGSLDSKKLLNYSYNETFFYYYYYYLGYYYYSLDLFLNDNSGDSY